MTPADLSRDEILMFLNTPEPGGHLSAMLDDCTEALCKAAQPRTIYRVLPVVHTDTGVTLGGLALQGKDIALHLTGCSEAVLLAATLSAPVDALIRRAEFTDMTRAVMLDAVAGAAVEHVCNELEAEIRAKYPYPYYTARFSADVYDASEMIPWIRTFLCRITEIHISSPELQAHFLEDMREMYAMYGVEGGEGA